MINQEQVKKNTDDLFAYFRQAYACAETEPVTVLRDCARRSVRNQEWHGLFLVLMVDAIRPLYDQPRIAARLDEMRRENTRTPWPE